MCRVWCTSGFRQQQSRFRQLRLRFRQWHAAFRLMPLLVHPVSARAFRHWQLSVSSTARRRAARFVTPRHVPWACAAASPLAPHRPNGRTPSHTARRALRSTARATGVATIARPHVGPAVRRHVSSITGMVGLPSTAGSGASAPAAAVQVALHSSQPFCGSCRAHSWCM